MKKRSNLIIFTLCAMLIFTSCGRLEKNSKETKKGDFENTVCLADNVRAMWISQFDLTLMCLKDGRQRKKDEYLSRVSLMMARLLGMGINTVFVQLRPNGDSIYPSELFPSSAYAVGTLGTDFDYDPFEILLNEANRAGISVHAWINPLRLMKDTELSSLDGKYLIGKWIKDKKYYGTRIVKVGDYCYLNPAYDEVREMIVSGACEIIDNYAVDGIHIDDYFYPTTSKDFDATSYKDCENGMPLEDFRRKNITLLVSALSEAARSRGKIFGVSPSGNTSRNYNELYADVNEWCELGIVDYICPQIYFGIEHETFPFEKTAREFEQMCSKNGTDLIIGMTLEKAQNGYKGIGDTYAGSGRDEWINNKDILARCFEITIDMNCKGVAFFSYRLFYSPSDDSPVNETSDERKALIAAIKQLK
jgi:uncharacterized lipoprotein YddW (UPF0748 family)